MADDLTKRVTRMVPAREFQLEDEFERGRASRDPEVAELRAEVERLRKIEAWVAAQLDNETLPTSFDRELRGLLDDEPKKGESDG